MARRERMARLAWSIATAFAAGALAGCDSPSALDARGGRAGTVATLWWAMLAIAALVFVIVVGLLLLAAARSFRLRRTRADVVIADDHDTRLILVGGVIVPAIVLVGLFLFTLRDMSAIAAPSQPAAFTIRVTGHQWWWEVRYPDQDIVTANEIHIPTGQQVRVEVDSPDVIHSFWVPQLAGKIDTIPGQTNESWIEADKPGVYRGQCAEFCGRQHANMAFLVVAEPPDQFAAWVAGQQQPAPAPSDPTVARGQQVLLASACVGCHTIDGTPAQGRVGPNLTHLASRRTIAAGTLPNTVGALGGWIADPQGVKPGTQMPPSRLEAADLQALLAYLETLK